MPPERMTSACRQGEREASATLLGKGFNIGCLMARYQGLDWREPSKWGCNAMIDPLLDGRYDGSTLQPYEVRCWQAGACAAAGSLAGPACHSVTSPAAGHVYTVYPQHS